MLELNGLSHTDGFVLTGVEADFLVLLLGPDVDKQVLMVSAGAFTLEVEMTWRKLH